MKEHETLPINPNAPLAVASGDWLGGLRLDFHKWPEEKPPYGKPCLVRGLSYDAHYQYNFDIAALTYCGDDAPAQWCRGKQMMEMYEVWEWALLPANMPPNDRTEARDK